MDLKKINKILNDLDDLGSVGQRISENLSPNYYEEKGQGDEGIKMEIYDIGEPDTFLKVVTTCDSYGSDERITQIQFVAPQEKLVTVYEPV